VSASEDLRKKLKLERQIEPKLLAYQAKIDKQFRSSFAGLGIIPPTEPFDAELAAILQGHYRATQRAFAGSIIDELPPKAAASSDEKAAIAAALALYFAKQARRQAEGINRTTDGDMQTAARMARESQSPEGPHLSQIEIALIASGLLGRALAARARSAAITETQGAAEATKATEAEVMLGLNPTIAGGDPKGREAAKTWRSVGDNRVRQDHLDADGQTVPVSEPFIVGGESLMYPGDSSLGASAAQIVNCRCGVEYDTAEIARSREEA
jgi:hypothetical protein